MMWKGYTASFASILCYHVLTWSASSLSVVTDSPSPIVVVLSGSMEPAFQRGDLLFLCTNLPEFSSWPRIFPFRNDKGLQG